jgi:signal transduction histidine kinase
MIKKLSPFWRVGVLQALAETLLVNAILMTGLLLSVRLVPSYVIQQGLLFLSPICALLCALRLRTPRGNVWRRFLHEIVVAVALSVVLIATACIAILILEFASQWGVAPVGGSVADVALAALLTMGCSGLAFLVFRACVWLWHCWGRLRRKRLLWALTHAHLTLVVVMAGLLAVVGTMGVLSDSDASGRVELDVPAAMFVHQVTNLVLPVAGLLVILMVMTLAMVLPPSALFSYLVSRRTTQRLQRLTTAARAMRQGDRGARVTVEGEDEVARLQSDFNAMADELERTLQDLEAQRDTVSGLLQSRRELIVGVSHELRTPVATVRAMLESALKQKGVRPASLRRDLEVMEGEVLRLQRLIDDLFTLSRLEVEQLTMTCQPTDMAPVVRRIVDAVAPLAWSGGRVEVVAELSSEPLIACVDEPRLEQILANLLRNGVRHTSPGGIVAVIVAAEEDAVKIEVRDTGEGISAEELPLIWERFYRGENARTDDVRGAGLGLALVKELTEAMGGGVGVESIVGEGSRFVVRLPKSDV